MTSWFENNSYYASHKQKKWLAKEAKITVVQVSKWLASQRARIKKNPGKKHTHKKLTKERKILFDFFEKQIKPDKEEIKKLTENTGRSAEQISKWFATQRFKLKNKKYNFDNLT